MNPGESILVKPQMSMVSMNKNERVFVLPDEVRPTLQRPLGKLFTDISKAIEHIRMLRPARLITVGDIVTSSFLNAGLKPDVAVVDFIVMRSQAGEKIKGLIESFNAPTVQLKNPAGVITPELWKSFENERFPVKIIVEGEEDLATIPAVITAPNNSVVAYGQPKEGVVLVEVTDEKRHEFQELLKKFKVKS